MNEQLIQVNNIIKALLDKIDSVAIETDNISQNEIMQLAAIINFIEEFNGFEFTAEVIILADKISININDHYLDKLTTDLKLLHLAYIVNVILNINQIDYIKNNYFKLLSRFDDMRDISDNFF